MTIDEIINVPQVEQIARFKEVPNDKFRAYIDEFLKSLAATFAEKTKAAATATAAAAGAPGGDGRRAGGPQG